MKQKRNAWNYEGIENYLRGKNITYLFDNCLWKNRLKDAAKHAVIICSGHLSFVINKEPQDKTFSLRLLYVFWGGNSPASEFYMPKFRNTLSVPSS